MVALAIVLDLLLALGATLRLTRFIVADDVPGQWWIKDPLYERSLVLDARDRQAGRDPYQGRRKHLMQQTEEFQPRWRYAEGLSCPYCVSVWMAGLTTLTLFLAGGPGDAADWWRYAAGFLTLAWLTGHIAARAGDTEE